MNAKNLFLLAVKIMGLYFLFGCVNDIVSASSNIGLAIYDFNYAGIIIGNILHSLLNLSIGIILILFSKKIIGYFKLDEDFGDENVFEFEHEKKSFDLTNLAFILLGIFILASEIPLLLTYIFQVLFNVNIDAHAFLNDVNKTHYWILPAIKIGIGLLIIGERQRIINWIAKKESIK